MSHCLPVRSRLRVDPETVPITNETSERIVRVVVLGLPPAALVCAGWLAWGGALRWQDLVVLAITYTLSGLGVTVGFHRLFTHRSFKTTRAMRAVLAVLGSTSVEGPVIEWVATHRKHHRFSDRPGDPHSPHVDQAAGWRGRGPRPRARPRRLDVPRQGHGQPAPLREGSARRPRPARDQPPVPAVGRSSGWPSRSGWASR